MGVIPRILSWGSSTNRSIAKVWKNSVGHFLHQGSEWNPCETLPHTIMWPIEFTWTKVLVLKLLGRDLKTSLQVADSCCCKLPLLFNDGLSQPTADCGVRFRSGFTFNPQWWEWPAPFYSRDHVMTHIISSGSVTFRFVPKGTTLTRV